MQDTEGEADEDPRDRKYPAVVGRHQIFSDICIDARHQDQRAEKQVPPRRQTHSAGLHRRFRIHCHDPASAAPDPSFLHFHIIQFPMVSIQKHHRSDAEFQQPYRPYDHKNRDIPETERTDGSTDHHVYRVEYLCISAIPFHKSRYFLTLRRALRQMHAQKHPL